LQVQLLVLEGKQSALRIFADRKLLPLMAGFLEAQVIHAFGMMFWLSTDLGVTATQSVIAVPDGINVCVDSISAANTDIEADLGCCGCFHSELLGGKYSRGASDRAYQVKKHLRLRKVSQGVSQTEADDRNKALLQNWRRVRDYSPPLFFQQLSSL
jgi:hypothetical protein